MKLEVNTQMHADKNELLVMTFLLDTVLFLLWKQVAMCLEYKWTDRNTL